MSSSQEIKSNNPEDDPSIEERVCLVRFAYHLWRVDAAARAFPHHIEDPEEVEMMKKRWEIGLVLEIVSFYSDFIVDRA